MTADTIVLACFLLATLLVGIGTGMIRARQVRRLADGTAWQRLVAVSVWHQRGKKR